MKIINYILLGFILTFIVSSILLKPTELASIETEYQSFEFPEVKLNIPLDNGISPNQSFNIDLPELSERTNLPEAWTVKVGSYENLEKLKKDLLFLKNQGYKVYSRNEREGQDKFSLFIGPTLLKEDSMQIISEINQLKDFNAVIRGYD